MLILGRREGDSIIIDGGIRIVIVSCDRGSVRIGIDAPSNVKILRGEIADQVKSENERAAAPGATEWLAALAAPSSAPTSVPTSAADGVPIPPPALEPDA